MATAKKTTTTEINAELNQDTLDAIVAESAAPLEDEKVLVKVISAFYTNYGGTIYEGAPSKTDAAKKIKLPAPVATMLQKAGNVVIS